MYDVGLEAQPLDFNPPRIVISTRALARYNRLLEARAGGQEIPDEVIEKNREAAYGKVN